MAASYASANPAERLTAVRETIEKIRNSQEYRNGDMMVQQALLRDWFIIEQKLETQVNQASSGVLIGQMTTFP